MSGENRAERNTPPDSTRARAAQADASRVAAGPPPLPPEPNGGATPAARIKKAKQPPGMITAGGVDMARGHAENIQPKGLGAALTPPVPKVVLSVETDARRVPTAPRLIAGGKSESERPPAAVTASPWGAAAVEVLDKRDLPSANLPVTPPPVVAPVKPKSGGWLRFAVVAMLLLLTAGIVRRVRMATHGSDAADDAQHTFAQAPPLPPEATADPTATANAHRRAVAALVPTEPDPAADLAADAGADAATEVDAAAEPEPSAAVIAARPRLAPPPPKPTFKPLFELPQEKAKETP